MQFFKPYRKSIESRLQTFFMMLSILAYLAAHVEFDTLHKAIHREEVEVSHNDNDEKDPCHRKLYHHDSTKGCDHKTHLAASKKCSLCDQHFSHDKVLHEITFSIVDHSESTPATVFAFSISDKTPLHLPARAPPAV